MAQHEKLKTIRALIQGCIETGHDRGMIGNLMAARDALDDILREAHYANGVADLAMKHRDDAESHAASLAERVRRLRGALGLLPRVLDDLKNAGSWDIATLNRVAEIICNVVRHKGGKMTKTVYLCGPINGCTDDEAKNWRDAAKAELPDTIDPMRNDYRGREMEPGIAKTIVETDKADVDAADIILVNYDKPSVGTSMEVLYAWMAEKPVVVVARPEAVLSPWLVYHSSKIVHSFSDAIDWIKQQ